VRAGVFRGVGDVRVEEVTEPRIRNVADVVVRVVRSSVCGSDLWPYRGVEPWESGWRTGHEITGVIEEVGSEVSTLAVGDLVVSAFAWSCGSCSFCREGLQTSCRTVQFPGRGGQDGGHAERARIPMAEGSVWKVPSSTPEERYDAVHLLSDVLLTGYHAALMSGLAERTGVAEAVGPAVVIGDGAVGLSALACAKYFGASPVVVVGHHEDRLSTARTLGADYTTALEGRDLSAFVNEVTDGGPRSVMECVGATAAVKAAVILARPGGSVAMVGVPTAVEKWPMGLAFAKNLTLRIGVAPVRAYMDHLGPVVASGALDVAPIASHRFALEELGAAYEAMDRRQCIKAMVIPK
jgi:alcohol dehydrogenase